MTNAEPLNPIQHTQKVSDTVLIDKKKGDETSITSYRPIGLANTLHKLWTCLITNTLIEYAEAHSLLG